MKDLNKKDKWTKQEALKVLIYCANTLKMIPSKTKIAKAKKALSN